MKQCIKYLIHHLGNDYVYIGYQLAMPFGLDAMNYICERKISANAGDIIKTKAFSDSNCIEFNQIMKLDSLVCRETQIFAGCMTWTENSYVKKSLVPFIQQSALFLV